MRRDGEPLKVMGPLRRPDQSYGVVCEFATDAEARAFTALVTGHFATATQMEDARVTTWHDVTGAFANQDQVPPPVAIVVESVTTTKGLTMISYRPVQS